MMVWTDLLPSDVARDQTAFERRMQVYRMHRDAGMRQKDIAAELGVSPTRVSEMVRRAESHIARGLRSPYERYCDDAVLDDDERRAVKAVIVSPPSRVRLGPPTALPQPGRKLWAPPVAHEAPQAVQQPFAMLAVGSFLMAELFRLGA